MVFVNQVCLLLLHACGDRPSALYAIAAHAVAHQHVRMCVRGGESAVWITLSLCLHYDRIVAHIRRWNDRRTNRCCFFFLVGAKLIQFYCACASHSKFSVLDDRLQSHSISFEFWKNAFVRFELRSGNFILRRDSCNVKQIRSHAIFVFLLFWIENERKIAEFAGKTLVSRYRWFVGSSSSFGHNAKQ